MKHAQTIAMARGLLADGRARDVARMLEPLVAPVLDHVPGALDAAQVVLRSLLARERLLHRGDPGRALSLLKPWAETTARDPLPDALRAEVAVWLGWALAWPQAPAYDGAHALHLLDEAERLFARAMNPAGRLWALLGQALAFTGLDEAALMRRALAEATALEPAVGDAQAACWTLDLLALEDLHHARYARGLDHADALEARAGAVGDRFARGRALAYRTALLDALGRPATAVKAPGAEASTLLAQAAARPDVWCEMAQWATAMATLRQGAWDDAERFLYATLDPATPSPLSLVQALLDVLQGRYEAAEAHLDAFDAASAARPSRLSAIRAALLRSLLALQRDRLDDAAADARRALALARRTGREHLQLEALLRLTRAEQARGDAGAALRHLHETDAYTHLFGVLPVAALRFEVLGEQAVLEDNEADADAFFDQAHTTWTLIGDAHQAARMLARRAALDRTRRPIATTPVAAEPDLGAALARAALSVDLIAEAWLQAAGRLLPGRWLGIYRCDEDRPWTCIRERGLAPAAPPRLAEPCSARLVADEVFWLRLRSHPGPAFFFGIADPGADDPARETALAHLTPWLPVARLALDHALLQETRRDAPPDARDEDPLPPLIYGSPAMRELVAQVRRLHASHSPVLITGEGGVGKETLARALHATGERRHSPFVRVACDAVTDGPSERSLFGSDNGAETPGALHAARGGTLYLDGVDALPVELQQKLLHVMESGSMQPTDPPFGTADVRIIAAAGSDLNEATRSGRFLEALLFRLHVIPLHVPPLRERREEIPLLIQHFLDGLRASGAPMPALTPDALNACLHYPWPGNVRQLRNELERAYALVENEPAPLIRLHDLTPEIAEGPNRTAGPSLLQRAQASVLRPGHDLDEVLAGTEKLIIERVLAEHDGQVSAAAGALGLTRQGLYKKLKRLGIDAARFQTSPA